MSFRASYVCPWWIQMRVMRRCDVSESKEKKWYESVNWNESVSWDLGPAVLHRCESCNRCAWLWCETASGFHVTLWLRPSRTCNVSFRGDARSPNNLLRRLSQVSNITFFHLCAKSKRWLKCLRYKRFRICVIFITVICLSYWTTDYESAQAHNLLALYFE